MKIWSDERRPKCKADSEEGCVRERKGPGTQFSRHAQLMSSTSRSIRPQWVVWDKHVIWSQRAAVEISCIWNGEGGQRSGEIVDSLRPRGRRYEGASANKALCLLTRGANQTTALYYENDSSYYFSGGYEIVTGNFCRGFSLHGQKYTFKHWIIYSATLRVGREGVLFLGDLQKEDRTR